MTSRPISCAKSLSEDITADNSDTQNGSLNNHNNFQLIVRSINGLGIYFGSLTPLFPLQDFLFQWLKAHNFAIQS
jgi:hypothetical protein